MLQVIRAILKHPEDKTQVSLIFANQVSAISQSRLSCSLITHQTEEDILCRAELEEFVLAAESLVVRIKIFPIAGAHGTRASRYGTRSTDRRSRGSTARASTRRR